MNRWYCQLRYRWYCTPQDRTPQTGLILLTCNKKVKEAKIIFALTTRVQLIQQIARVCVLLCPRFNVVLCSIYIFTSLQCEPVRVLSVGSGFDGPLSAPILLPSGIIDTTESNKFCRKKNKWGWVWGKWYKIRVVVLWENNRTCNAKEDEPSEHSNRWTMCHQHSLNT